MHFNRKDVFMDRILLIGTFVCIGILALFFILNIIRAVRGKEASKVFTIGLHLSGIAAAVFNAVRVFRIYDDHAGKKAKLYGKRICTVQRVGLSESARVVHARFSDAF